MIAGPPRRGNDTPGLPRGLLQDLEEQTLHRRLAPVPLADDASDKPPRTVDHVCRGWAEDAIAYPRDLTLLVNENGRGIAALDGRALDERRILAEAHEPDLEPLAPQLRVEAIDGRQLLPAGRSPRRPEEEEHHLAAQVLEPRYLAVGVRQGESRGGLGRLIGLGLERGPVRGGGGRPRRKQQDTDHRRPAHHEAPDSLSALSRSPGSSRSSGLSITLT